MSQAMKDSILMNQPYDIYNLKSWRNQHKPNLLAEVANQNDCIVIV